MTATKNTVKTPDIRLFSLSVFYDDMFYLLFLVACGGNEPAADPTEAPADGMLPEVGYFPASDSPLNNARQLLLDAIE